MSATNTIQAAVQRYLDERRQLGFDLGITGGQLMRFARYADARGHHGPLTLDIQLDWAREHVHRTGPVTWARRLEVVRPFAAYYRQFEPQSEVPDLKTFGRGHRRLAPHIYTEQEICDLLNEAGRLTPQGGLRPATYRTLFGLIAAAGLRRSEALHLRDVDVDLQGATVTVRQTKFKKSRRLPVHYSVVQALHDYRRLRDRFVPRSADMPLFVSTSGCALPSNTVQQVFEGLRARLGWTSRGDHPHPRIQDLRHAFATRRVQRWHEAGVPMDQAMFWLCTYLGHAKISDTYWYLTGVPELMAVIGAKFETFAHGEVDHE
jgi:site-specific recombinase XerD